MSTNDRSLLDSIELQFRRIGRDQSLTLDGRSVHCELPQRSLSVLTLRSVLLHPSTSNDARNAVLTEVVYRARQSQEWQIVLLGLLLPGLGRARSRFVRTADPIGDDIDSAFIAGVLERLQAQLPNERIARVLVSYAKRRAESVVRQEEREHRGNYFVTNVEPVSSAGPLVVLDRLVSSRVLSKQEAELVAATRIEGTSVRLLAESLGVSSDTLRHRRRRIEARIAAELSKEIS